MDDAVGLVDGLVVRRLARRLDAAALVDGDVDDHRPGLHRPHHVLAHDDRRPPARHEHGADDQVGVVHGTLDRAPVRRHGHDPSLVDLIHPAQAVEVLVDHHDLRLHAGGDPRRVPADIAGAEDDDLGRAHAGRSPHQHAAPSLVALEEVGTLLGCEPPGDLAHRGQQWQRAGVELHRLVGEGGGPGREQRLGDVGIGGEMQVREQREVVPKVRELLLLRLFDLDDELLRPGVLGGRHDVGPGRPVIGVGDRGALARTGLDVHLDPVALELADPVGRHRHPVFRGLDLLRHADGVDGCGHGAQRNWRPGAPSALRRWWSRRSEWKGRFGTPAPPGASAAASRGGTTRS